VKKGRTSAQEGGNGLEKGGNGAAEAHQTAQKSVNPLGCEFFLMGRALRWAGAAFFTRSRSS
jgi:hypothetical protein